MHTVLLPRIADHSHAIGGVNGVAGHRFNIFPERPADEGRERNAPDSGAIENVGYDSRGGKGKWRWVVISSWKMLWPVSGSDLFLGPLTTAHDVLFLLPLYKRY